MAVSNLLPMGNSAATSAPIALGANATFTLFGMPSAGTDNLNWVCIIDRQATNGDWFPVDELSGAARIVTIYGEGTYRVRRAVGTCLVDLAQ